MYILATNFKEQLDKPSTSLCVSTVIPQLKFSQLTLFRYYVDIFIPTHHKTSC
jgi:hypothetical protein